MPRGYRMINSMWQPSAVNTKPDLAGNTVNTVLLMDIGGTHTRCRIIEYSDPACSVPRNIVSRSQDISTKYDLLSFINRLIAEYTLQHSLAAAVLGFAGAVSSHSRACMTNWKGDRDVQLNELATCGLPADTTLLINDMEMAAYGLLKHTSSADGSIIPLHTPVPGRAETTGSMLLLMPGTGMGISAILPGATTGITAPPLVVTCETQHTPVPVLDEYHGELLQEIKKLPGMNRPSWEDLVSGRGLELIYRSLVNLDSRAGGAIKQTHNLSAAIIAEQAVAGENELCQRALGIYYRCAGALAQVLALTFRPYRGIYLAGNSTRNNMSYIPYSGFMNALHDNVVHGSMLENFPVFIVRTDLNLDGADHLAGLALQKAAPLTSSF